MSLTQQHKYEAPEKDEVFDILSNHRRRYVIHYCKLHENPVSLSDLAEQVAAWEQDKPVTELTSSERKRVYTSLQQTHLDRLAESGLISYERDQISLSDDAQELDIYLDIVPAKSIPWGVYYLGLSLISGLVLLGVWLGFVPTDTVPTIGWAFLMLLLFLGSSIAQVAQNRRYRLDQLDKPP